MNDVWLTLAGGMVVLGLVVDGTGPLAASPPAPVRDGLFVRLRAAEQTAEREARSARRADRRLRRLGRRLESESGDASLAARARRRVGRELADELAAWEVAHRHDQRLGLIGAATASYAPLLAAATGRSLGRAEGPLTSYRRLEQESSRSDRLYGRLVELSVDRAEHRAAERAARVGRRRLIREVTSSENRERVRRAIEQTEKQLEQALAAFFAHAPGRDFHRKKGQLARPVMSEIDRGFGRRRRSESATYVRHTGLTYRVEPGAAVHAVAGGIVVYADRFEGYGRLVIVDHGGGYHSIYAHLESFGVRTGDRVERADVIARTGESGSIEGPHLYFELRRDGRPIDPAPWLIHD